MKKLNKKVLRSAQKEERAGSPSPQTERQKKKQALDARKEEHLSHVPHPLTAEEQNKKMLHRVPVFDRNKAAPRHAKASKKKTPRI